MTLSGDVDIAGEELRRAISSGSHEIAAAVLDQYRRAVEAKAASFRPGDPAGVRLLREALELLEWARRATMSARAHYSRQFSALPDPQRYGSPASRPSVWDVLV